MNFWDKAREQNDARETSFLVVHPLDDAPEVKLDCAQLGRMPMTRGARASLLALRAYLALMTLLLGYRVLVLAGITGHMAR